MKRFNFKLETPLKVKKINENLRKQKLAEAIQIKLKEENRLDDLLLTDVKTRSELKNKLSASVEAQDLCSFNTYIDDLNSGIQFQKVAVDNAITAYDRSRLTFIETRKERQVFEKIKEKKFGAYLKEMNSEEQKQSDESAAASHIFRGGRT